jgi:hypothetical protein
MTTLQQLIDKVEADLADSGNSTWSAADITQWVRDGIADYSIHFPRTKNSEISSAAGGQEYDLPADFIAILTVEYPQGQAPPRYLQRKDYAQPGFWDAAGYFDIIHTTDAGNVSSLVLSDVPAGGETIEIYYRAQHDHALATSATVTVPEHHQHLVRAYARWQAELQLKIAEEKAPTSNSSLLMAQLAQNAYRAEQDYRALLRAAEREFAGRDTAALPWRWDDWSARRIY